MRRALATVALFLCGSLLAGATGASYSLDVDIAPLGQSGNYTCKAVVTDLETGKVVSAPLVQLSTASPAYTKSADGDLVSEFNVSVDPKTSRVTAELKVSSGGKVVAVQKMSVAVR